MLIMAIIWIAVYTTVLNIAVFVAYGDTLICAMAKKYPCSQLPFQTGFQIRKKDSHSLAKCVKENKGLGGNKFRK